jgi:hypothetical protein
MGVAFALVVRVAVVLLLLRIVPSIGLLRSAQLWLHGLLGALGLRGEGGVARLPLDGGQLLGLDVLWHAMR